ncbi:MAG TPA: sensor histidine kinase [Ruminiclostridium sp.]|nr:sensor histidine kinase [Clostridiaceae bacterium]HAA25536.1 sensor histidine kinase [Ruminiclostridium sp.]
MKRNLLFIKWIYKVIRNTFKINSIQSVISLSFTAVTIFALVFVSVTLYSVFSKTAERNAASSTQQIIEQVNINLENYLMEMMEVSSHISNNLSIDNLDNLSDILSVTTGIRKDIVTVAVFNADGEIVVCNPKGEYDKNYKISEQKWFQYSLDNIEEYNFVSPHVQRLFVGMRPWVVSLCRGTKVSANNETWVVMVDMNFSVMEQLCKKVSLGKRGYIYVIDQYGDIVYHPQQQIIYVGLKHEDIKFALEKEDGSYYYDLMGERRIVTINTVKYTKWKIIGISYLDEIVENRKSLSTLVVFISIFSLLFVIAASLFVSAKISEPIKKLEREMKKVESGNFNIDIDIDIDAQSEDEVKRLSKAFNMMVKRIQNLMEQIISEQEAKRKSELKALQAQINPHFLYNTLDSIVWMNENKDYAGVTTMVVALSQFFRISISRGKELIPVSDEIEHIKSYLTIQKIRYKNKFTFNIDAQPEALGYKTLKLILQPIVENAIYHGVEQLYDEGIINIRVSVEGETVLFQVIDNGYGIKPDILKNILNRKDGSKSDHGGVGLKNVNERIKLFFGELYGIEIFSTLDVGTTVNIRIPIIK